MKWSVGTKIGTGFGLALPSVTVLGTVTYRTMSRMSETARWVEKSHASIAELASVITKTRAFELAQRDDLIGGNEAALERMRALKGEIEQDFRDVAGFVNDDPKPRPRIFTSSDKLSNSSCSTTRCD